MSLTLTRAKHHYPSGEFAESYFLKAYQTLDEPSRYRGVTRWQKRILEGEVLQEGDKADIATKDGKIHQTKVASVKDGAINGETRDEAETSAAFGPLMSLP